MIDVAFKVLGGHTHIIIRAGNNPGSRALCGDIIMDNADADVFLDALERASQSGGIHVHEVQP